MCALHRRRLRYPWGQQHHDLPFRAGIVIDENPVYDPVMKTFSDMRDSTIRGALGVLTPTIVINQQEA